MGKLQVIIGLSLLLASGVAEADEARICHIANAGFYVTDGEKGVLLDAVLGEPYPPYQQPSESLNSAIETSAGPFKDVMLVFASHYHGDHFDGPAMVRHMMVNRDARYIVTPQALREMPGTAAGNRIISKLPSENNPDSYELNGIPVTLYHVSHGANRPIDNIGIRFELAGKSFFHPGDIFTSLDALQKAGIDNLQVDYLLAPIWLLLDEEEIEEVRQAFSPKNVIPMHFLEESAAGHAGWIKLHGGWQGVKEKALTSFPNTLEMFGEMDCYPL